MATMTNQTGTSEPSAETPDAPEPASERNESRSSALPASTERLRDTIQQLHRLMMLYEFGMQEIMTKVNILRSEFQRTHEYNPIEHVSSRLKSPESLIKKVHKKQLSLDAAVIRESVQDIAGVRLTCSFVSDIYRMRDLLLKQSDLTLVRERDYIQNPKANGYKSLHLVVEVPVFLAEGVEQVPVEIQLRTVAMDFWASLEHKIYYKYDKVVPRHLTDALKLAADMAATLDTSMERIHQEILELDVARRKEEGYEGEEQMDDIVETIMRSFPDILDAPPETDS